MNNEALRDYAFWDNTGDTFDYDGEGGKAFGCLEDHDESVAVKPIRVYSKRSSFIQEIRDHSKWAAAHADEDLSPPTPAAQAAAEFVINQLPEGCLDFHLAIAHSGEINLFFGQKDSPFQMLIDEDGLVSYFGKFGDERFAGSDLSPSTFPYMRFLCLLGADS